MSVVGMELSIQHDVSDRCFCFLLDLLILRVILLSVLIQRRQGIRTPEEIFYEYILYGSFIEFHVVSARYVQSWSEIFENYDITKKNYDKQTR